MSAGWTPEKVLREIADNPPFMERVVDLLNEDREAGMAAAEVFGWQRDQAATDAVTMAQIVLLAHNDRRGRGCGTCPRGEPCAEGRGARAVIDRWGRSRPRRTTCAACRGPYDEDTDGWGVCASCAEVALADYPDRPSLPDLLKGTAYEGLLPARFYEEADDA